MTSPLPSPAELERADAGIPCHPELVEELFFTLCYAEHVEA